MSGLIHIAPLLFLTIGGLVMLLVDAFVEEKSELALMATMILSITTLIAVGLWVYPPAAPVPEFISGYLATDPAALFFDVTIGLGALFATLFAGGYLKEHGLERGEFYPLVLFSALGAMVLARSTDMLSLFLGLETMSLGVYSLVAWKRSSPRATEAALKYFLLGSFAAAILLFGSALLYGATGHTDLVGIGASIKGGSANNVLVLLGLMLVIVGLAFKAGAVPFHMWTPDAYEGATTPVTVFMSVAVKAAVFGVFVRLLLVAFGDPLTADLSTGWPPVLAGLAAVTMIVGNLAALVQTSVKRMLAYSSIAHAGYLFVGLVAAAQGGEQAASSVFFYVLTYTVSNALAFGSLILLGTRGKESVSYEDLAGVGRRHPLAALPFVLGILSLMGFPPTAGFFGKYYLFQAAVGSGGGLVWLVVLGVLTSAFGAFYYLRVLVFMYMREPERGAPVAVPMRSWYVVIGLAVSAYFVLKIGVAPGHYLEFALAAAKGITG